MMDTTRNGALQCKAAIELGPGGSAPAQGTSLQSQRWEQVLNFRFS